MSMFLWKRDDITLSNCLLFSMDPVKRADKKKITAPRGSQATSDFRVFVLLLFEKLWIYNTSDAGLSIFSSVQSNIANEDGLSGL